MIAHATHHAERPLPSCSVTLTALFFPPQVAIHRGEKISPLGADAEARDYKKPCRKLAAKTCALMRDNLHAARIELYRPAMIGNGWMSAVEIGDKADKPSDSVRQRMERLIASGDVESQRMQNSTRLYRWIGA